MLQSMLEELEQTLALHQDSLDNMSSWLPKDQQRLFDCKIFAVSCAVGLNHSAPAGSRTALPFHLGLSTWACSCATAVRRCKASDEVLATIEQLGTLVSRLDRGKVLLGSAGHHR